MPKVKVARDEWLILGKTLFSKKGIDGINVEKMAKKLDCNKSSFYWHFKDRNTFLIEVIEHWLKKNSGSIISITYFKNNPNKTFDTFLEKSFKDQSRGDLIFFLRKIALKDERFAQLVEDIDKKRVDYVSLMLRDLGYSEEDILTKAKLYLHFYRGWYQANKDIELDDVAIQDAKNIVRSFIAY